MDSVEHTRRMLVYRLCLLHLKEMGFSSVYSYTIEKETGFTATLIRKDLSRLHAKGKRKGGYDIDHLLDLINNYFGIDSIKKIVLAGMGNIGNAISNYKGFEEQNIKIVAGFDINPARLKKRFSVPVYPIDQCNEIIGNQKIDAAIIAVPAISAQEVCDKFIQCGINGIMNFSPVNLKAPSHVFIYNIRLIDELLCVIYHSSQKR